MSKMCSRNSLFRKTVTHIKWQLTFWTCFLCAFSLSFYESKTHCKGNAKRSPPLRILLRGRLASALFLSSSSAHHKHHEQRQRDPTHYFLKIHTREQSAQGSHLLWASELDSLMSAGPLEWFAFSNFSLSLSLSFFLSLCLHFVWFLPCVSSDTFLHENSWRKNWNLPFQMLWFTATSAEKK